MGVKWRNEIMKMKPRENRGVIKNVNADPKLNISLMRSRNDTKYMKAHM